MSAPDQKSLFQSLVEETIGEEVDYDVMRNIHENLNTMLEDHKEEEVTYELSKDDVKHLLADSGVPEERMDYFEHNYKEIIGEQEQPLLATNIANTKKFDISAPNVVIKVDPDRADLVESRIIDGRQCLVIEVDDHIEVNGINVRTFLKD